MGQEGKWSAGEVIGMSGAYWAGCALQAGVKLDLFTALEGGGRETASLAAELACDCRALDMLLTALTALGFLTRKDDVFSAVPDALRLLSRRSDEYLGYIILHHYSLVGAWAELDRSVRTGQATRKDRASTTEDADDRKNFLLGMFNIASFQARVVAEGLDLTGVRRLLDLGGGPGTYAVAFCRAKADLTATVFDLPTTEPVAMGIIERFAMQNRVDFVGGDFERDSLPTGYDLVWISQILHGCAGPEGAAQLVAKAAGCLNRGGRICIQEFALDAKRDGPAHSALFGLNMLVQTDRGQVYSMPEMAGMLHNAGATSVSFPELDLPSGCRIVCGQFA